MLDYQRRARERVERSNAMRLQDWQNIELPDFEQDAKWMSEVAKQSAMQHIASVERRLERAIINGERYVKIARHPYLGGWDVFDTSSYGYQDATGHP